MPSSSPPKRCVLHVGHPKTASTYIQTALHLNEDALERSGFWVPSDFRQFGSYHFRELAEAGHTFSGNLQTVFEASEAQQSDRVNQLLHYILHSRQGSIIISSELLFYYNFVVWDITRRAMAAGYQVLILAYLARQDRAAIADYLQNIRNHQYHGTVVEFLESKRREKHLQYASVLDSYNVEPPARIVVRTFDRRFMLGGEILSDFLAICRCPLKLPELRLPASELNTGLPLEWCEVLRGLNEQNSSAAERIRDAKPPFGNDERARIREHYFSEEARDFVLSEYAHGNRDLLETYLGDRSQEERAYWSSIDAAGKGVAFDASQMAGCLALLQH